MSAAEERKRVVIVDGYTTGWDIARELLERNVECLHLQSSGQLPPIARAFNPALFPVNLGYLSDAKAAAEGLYMLRPDAVIAGSDCGVAFAEHVADLLGLPTNRRETAIAKLRKLTSFQAHERPLSVGDRVRRSAGLQPWAVSCISFMRTRTRSPRTS